MAKRLGRILLLLGLLICKACAALAGARCIAQRDCSTGEFCANPLLSRLPGSCQSCWLCCLFPSVYGTASCSRCGCGTTNVCYSSRDCGPAEFCAAPDSALSLPTCRSCASCRTDSQSVLGSCAASCPSGALEANGVAEGQAGEAAAGQYLFAAFDIAGNTQAAGGLGVGPGGVVSVTMTSLRSWLLGSGLAGDVADRLMQGLPALPPEQAPGYSPEAAASAEAQQPRVALSDFAENLASLAPRNDPLCPLPPSPGAQGTAARAVPAGCPCNATFNADTFRCPAGQRCSRRAWSRFPGDIVSRGPTALLQARCVSCEPGSYCPEGTYVEAEDDAVAMAQLDCPAGRYCAGPNSSVLCPAGFFCPARATEPTTCDYAQLLDGSQALGDSVLLASKRQRETLVRLRSDREPMRGNTCPPGSQLPSSRCRAGYYCPDPARQLPCPSNSFCRAESVAPWPCPRLARCEAPPATALATSADAADIVTNATDGAGGASAELPPGAAAPYVWPAAAAAVVGLAAAALVAAALLTCLDRSQRHTGRSETEQDRRSRGERALRDVVAFFHRRRAVPSLPWFTAAVEPHDLLVDCLSWRVGGGGGGGGRDRSADADADGGGEGGEGCKDAGAGGTEAGGVKGRPAGQLVLHGVTARFLSGQLSAVLGPSGCGKTSLLALLAGRASHWPPCAGRLLVNGSAVTDPRVLRRVTGFVPQDDVLCADLTIRENLEYSAQLRLPRRGGLADRLRGIMLAYGGAGSAQREDAANPAAGGAPGGDCEHGRDSGNSGSTDSTAAAAAAGCAPLAAGVEAAMALHCWPRPKQELKLVVSCREERALVVDAVLDMMSLRGHQNARVGSVEERGISGGQRKRVNIGVELVARPSMLFLDEPTSGLDASCCSDVLHSLSDLAATGGVNVVAVVHQPRYSTFELFDEVLLLGSSGRTVYHGAPAAAVDYFSRALGYCFPPHENVADTLLDIVAGKRYSESCSAAQLPERWEQLGEEWAAGTPPRRAFAPHSYAGSVDIVASIAAPADASPRLPSVSMGAAGRLHDWQRPVGPAAAGRLASEAATPTGRTARRQMNGQEKSDSPLFSDEDEEVLEGERADFLASLPRAGFLAKAAAAAAAAATASASPPAAGHSAGGAAKPPELTQEVKDIIEAEFDRLLRLAAAAAADSLAAAAAAGERDSAAAGPLSPGVGRPSGGAVAAAVRLARGASMRLRAFSGTAANSGGGGTAIMAGLSPAAAMQQPLPSAAAPPPDGLNRAQLLELFAALGQDGPDAEALVDEILYEQIAPYIQYGIGVGGAAAATPPLASVREALIVRKPQLIRALQRVADGRLTAPARRRELPAAVLGAATATGMMNNPLASAASASFEAFVSLPRAAVRALQNAAISLRRRGGGSPRPTESLASALNSGAVHGLHALHGIHGLGGAGLSGMASNMTDVSGTGFGPGRVSATGLAAPRPSTRQATHGSGSVLLAPVSSLMTTLATLQESVFGRAPKTRLSIAGGGGGAGGLRQAPPYPPPPLVVSPSPAAGPTPPVRRSALLSPTLSHKQQQPPTLPPSPLSPRAKPQQSTPVASAHVSPIKAVPASPPRASGGAGGSPFNCDVAARAAGGDAGEDAAYGITSTVLASRTSDSLRIRKLHGQISGQADTALKPNGAIGLAGGATAAAATAGGAVLSDAALPPSPSPLQCATLPTSSSFQSICSGSVPGLEQPSSPPPPLPPSGPSPPAAAGTPLSLAQELRRAGSDGADSGATELFSAPGTPLWCTPPFGSVAAASGSNGSEPRSANNSTSAAGTSLAAVPGTARSGSARPSPMSASTQTSVPTVPATPAVGKAATPSPVARRLFDPATPETATGASAVAATAAPQAPSFPSGNRTGKTPFGLPSALPAALVAAGVNGQGLGLPPGATLPEGAEVPERAAGGSETGEATQLPSVPGAQEQAAPVAASGAADAMARAFGAADAAYANHAAAASALGAKISVSEPGCLPFFDNAAASPSGEATEAPPTGLVRSGSGSFALSPVSSMASMPTNPQPPQSPQLQLPPLPPPPPQPHYLHHMPSSPQALSPSGAAGSAVRPYQRPQSQSSAQYPPASPTGLSGPLRPLRISVGSAAAAAALGPQATGLPTISRLARSSMSYTAVAAAAQQANARQMRMPMPPGGPPPAGRHMRDAGTGFGRALPMYPSGSGAFAAVANGGGIGMQQLQLQHMQSGQSQDYGRKSAEKLIGMPSQAVGAASSDDAGALDLSLPPNLVALRMYAAAAAAAVADSGVGGGDGGGTPTRSSLQDAPRSNDNGPFAAQGPATAAAFSAGPFRGIPYTSLTQSLQSLPWHGQLDQQQQQQMEPWQAGTPTMCAPPPRSFSSLVPWPGWLSQLGTFASRAVLQARRAFWPASVLEVTLLLAAAIVVGSNQGTSWGPTAVPGHVIMALLCLAVLAVVQHLRTFTCNRLVLDRERAAGLSATAYFTARCLTDLPWVLIAPAIFVLPYYALTAPRAPVGAYYIVAVGVWWWASGLSYLLTLAPLLPPAAAPTAAVLMTLIAGAFLHGGGSPTLAGARGTVLEALLGLSYSRWSLEALTVSELDRYMDSHRNVIALMYREKGTCGVDRVLIDDGDDSRLSSAEAVSFVQLSSVFGPGYCNFAWRADMLALFGLGLALRLAAALALKYGNTVQAYADAAVRWWRARPDVGVLGISVGSINNIGASLRLAGRSQKDAELKAEQQVVSGAAEHGPAAAAPAPADGRAFRATADSEDSDRSLLPDHGGGSSAVVPDEQQLPTPFASTLGIGRFGGLQHGDAAGFGSVAAAYPSDIGTSNLGSVKSSWWRSAFGGKASMQQSIRATDGVAAAGTPASGGLSRRGAAAMLTGGRSSKVMPLVGTSSLDRSSRDGGIGAGRRVSESGAQVVLRMASSGLVALDGVETRVSAGRKGGKGVGGRARGMLATAMAALGLGGSAAGVAGERGPGGGGRVVEHQDSNSSGGDEAPRPDEVVAGGPLSPCGGQQLQYRKSLASVP